MIQEKSNNQLTNWELVSVNPSDKIWNWKDLFCFWGNSLQSIIGFSLVASLYLLYNLNFVLVFASLLSAGFLVIIFSNIIGSISQKHGLPFPAILRISMGVKAAKYVAMSRGIVALIMFGIQTYFLSKAIGFLFRVIFFSIDNGLLDNELFLLFFMGMNLLDWFSLFLTIILQVVFFSIGHLYNKKIINFSAYFVYFGLFLFSLIVFSETPEIPMKIFHDLFAFENLISMENLVPYISVTGTMFAYFSILILNFGDFSRYVKNNSELKKGNLSLLLNIILFSIFSIFIVVMSDNYFGGLDKILTNPMDIIGKFDNLYLSFISLIFIIIASFSTNLIANYIPAQNALINFAPKALNINNVSFIIGVSGLIIGSTWLVFLSQSGILSLIDTLGSLFGPIFGVVILDYFYLKNKIVNNKDLYSLDSSAEYYFTYGWHIKAIYSLLIGFIFSASTIWNLEFQFLQSYSWFIGAIMASFVYYLLSNKN